ncbi:MAG TPA: hypothetical protein VFS85_00755, partial [Dongiaceae bacterium]|nr:hypothetical protein [Dongiaceae bacterium]
MARLSRQDRNVAALLIAAAIGLLLLPWYAIEDGIWGFGWLAAYPDAKTAPALLQAASFGAGWLWPLFLALVIPLPALFNHRHGAFLVTAGGAFGLVYLFLEGFL